MLYVVGGGGVLDAPQGSMQGGLPSGRRSGVRVPCPTMYGLKGQPL